MVKGLRASLSKESPPTLRRRLSPGTSGDTAPPPPLSSSASNGGKVVMGISASAGEAVEDWSADFEDDGHEAPIVGQFMDNGTDERGLRAESDDADMFQPCVRYTRRPSGSSGSELALSPPPAPSNEKSTDKVGSDRSSHRSVRDIFSSPQPDTRVNLRNSMLLQASSGVEDDSEEENWDAEFGVNFEDDEEDEEDPTCMTYPTLAAAKSRRKDFNAMRQTVRDLLEDDEIQDDEQSGSHAHSSLSPRHRNRKSSDEQLFQRQRPSSFDDDASRDCESSVTSFTGNNHFTEPKAPSPLVECALADKYRLIDTASSSAYAVRIERYPKVCSSYSHLETLPGYSVFTENSFENFLHTLARKDAQKVADALEKDRAKLGNVQLQKAKRFQSLVSEPFGPTFVRNYFQQVSIYRFFSENESNEELVRLFFDKVSTVAMASDPLSTQMSLEDYKMVAGYTLELLQEAGRMFGPFCHRRVPRDEKERKEGRIRVRQFQYSLRECSKAFPEYADAIALVELRYVVHHLSTFEESELTYTWQVCSSYSSLGLFDEEELSMEALERYAALFSQLTRRCDRENRPETSTWKFALTNDPFCLRALLLSDIQRLYQSVSALSGEPVSDTSEYFEVDDDQEQASPQDFTQVRVWRSADRVRSLVKLPSFARRSALTSFYDDISAEAYPLIKARVALSLCTLHRTSPGFQSLRTAEALAYDAVRLLHKYTQDEDVSSHTLCIAEGLLSELGREALEALGNLLVQNEKYRYGVLCLEAASRVYSFLHQGSDYYQLNRELCAITVYADDVDRALPLHEKEAASAQLQGKTTEFVYLVSTLTKLWVQNGDFAKAEDNLLQAFGYLREQVATLPPFYSSSPRQVRRSGSEAASSVRSSTMLTTTSSSASSSMSGSFMSRHSNCSESDSMLKYDLDLHLQLRQVYKTSGRVLEGAKVLDYVLHYTSRLPRGKRTELRMLLAEDCVKLRLLDSTQTLLDMMDKDARQSDPTSSIVSTDSNGSRGPSATSEARYALDMVSRKRYALCRARVCLHQKKFRAAFSWLSLAHARVQSESLQDWSKLRFLDGKVLLSMLHAQQEGRIVEETMDVYTLFSTASMNLDEKEKEMVSERLHSFDKAIERPEELKRLGMEAFDDSLEQSQALDDGLHKLKSILAQVELHLAPLTPCFLAMGSCLDKERLSEALKSVFKSTDGGQLQLSDLDGEDDVCQEAFECLNRAMTLLRRAMVAAEQVSLPSLSMKTLLLCAQTWLWMELVRPEGGKRVKQCAAFWEESVKILKSVYLRRVCFQEDVAEVSESGSHSRYVNGYTEHTPYSFSMLPLLNFSHGFIHRLHKKSLAMIVLSGQLQALASSPSYIHDMVQVHADELLSAQLSLSSILHELESFREAHSHLFQPVTSLKSLTTDRRDAPSHKYSGSFGSSRQAPARRGHKKNQSMSAISEMLAPKARPFMAAPFAMDMPKHDAVPVSVRMPRTGLATLSDRTEASSFRTVPCVRERALSEAQAVEASAGVQVMDLADLRLTPTQLQEQVPSGRFALDEVQSARLWHLFASWKTQRKNYCRGKTDSVHFRWRNLRQLRLLLDAFDPTHVAVTDSESAGDLPVFDVAHLNGHALVQHPRGTFNIAENKVERFEWDEAQSSAYWISHFESMSVDADGIGAPIARTLQRLSVSTVVRALGALLTESPMVVVGGSFCRVKETTLTLLTLLRPFFWQHTTYPFIPVSCWKSMADAMRRESSFLVGTTTEAWRCAKKELAGKQSLVSKVTVLHLDSVEPLRIAKGSVEMPNKWRKQLISRMEKAAKARRKADRGPQTLVKQLGVFAMDMGTDDKDDFMYTGRSSSVDANSQQAFSDALRELYTKLLDACDSVNRRTRKKGGLKSLFDPSVDEIEAFASVVQTTDMFAHLTRDGRIMKGEYSYGDSVSSSSSKRVESSGY